MNRALSDFLPGLGGFLGGFSRWRVGHDDNHLVTVVTVIGVKQAKVFMQQATQPVQQAVFVIRLAVCGVDSSKLRASTEKGCLCSLR